MAAWYGLVYIASSVFSRFKSHPSGLKVQNLPTAGNTPEKMTKSLLMLSENLHI